MSSVNAYIAGFFDGEGSVTASVHDNVNGAELPTLHIQANISQVKVEPLQLIKLHFGGSISFMENKTNLGRKGQCQKIYHYTAYGKGVSLLFSSILPYLLVKRETVELALKMDMIDLRVGRLTSTEVIELKKERLREKWALAKQLADINAANRGGRYDTRIYFIWQKYFEIPTSEVESPALYE